MIEVDGVAVGVLAADRCARDGDRCRRLSVRPGNAIERVVDRERNDDLGTRRLADKIEAVVEELSEQRENAVGRGNARIGGANVEFAVIGILSVVAAVGTDESVVRDDGRTLNQGRGVNVVRIGRPMGRVPVIDDGLVSDLLCERSRCPVVKA